MNGQIALAVRVRLHDGRYHGAGDWPPSPSRLFQALIAAAGPAAELPAAVSAALEWLEGLAPPVVTAPAAPLGQEVSQFVPNNDLDAVDGDPTRVAEIRARKWVRPRLIEADPVITYLWEVDAADEDRLVPLRALAAGLCQLGRGVDAASAELFTADPDTLITREMELGARVFRPGPSSGLGLHVEAPLRLLCPCPGSLASLQARYRAQSERLSPSGRGRAARLQFTQAPRPRFLEVAYGAARVRAVFDLRSADDLGGFAPAALAGVGQLVETIRDGAAERLRTVFPELDSALESHLIGRGAKARGPGRIRIVALPSVGHQHVDLRVRRVLVEIPTPDGLRPEDVLWAFSGLTVAGSNATLVPAAGAEMLRHYGIGSAPARRWRSVTPLALPREGVAGPHDLAHHVVQAVRHAGLGVGVEAVLARREPFDRHGQPSGAFAEGTRFESKALWHVELTFRRPIAGPVVLGDGRYLGLGLCRPVAESPEVVALRVRGGLQGSPAGEALARALRRATLARFQVEVGAPPDWLHGHGVGAHVAFSWDPPRERLLVLDPLGAAGARFGELRRALAGLEVLRAGASGSLTLENESADPDMDPILAMSKEWVSVTPYEVERHRACGDAAAAVRADVLDALARLGLQPDEVIVEQVESAPGRSLRGRVRVRFASVISGPLLLGRSRFLGGGLFEGLAPGRDG